MRQFLAESLLLSFAGGTLGVFAAFWAVDALIALSPSNVPRLGDVSINVPVLLFALDISVAVAVAIGISAGLRGTSGDLCGALVEHGQASGGTLRGQHLGRVIVAGQLATTLVLLVGAGLLGRSLLRLLSVDPGFRTDHVLTIDLALPPAFQDAGKSRRIRFLGELFTRLRALPGVQEVGGPTRCR